MITFDDFISQQRTKDKIGKIADRFEGYLQSNYGSLLPGDIELLLSNWLQNFEQFEDIDYELALRILDNLTIAKDKEIRELFITTINNKILPEINADITDIYICPLGEAYESSYRLSAIFNNQEEAPYYKPGIKVLLEALKQKPNAVIVFFDDFLFSGGQLVCIFKKLLGIKLDADDTDDIYAERIEIGNPNLIEVFKEHKIILYFHLAFLAGYENKKFVRLVSENGLNEVKIYSGHIEKEDTGCFGTARDIQSIEGRSKYPFHSGVFANVQPTEVKPLYELLKEAGEQLLRNEHPEGKKWTAPVFKKHALGYGGKAKLILGEQNVPTSTLTALWLPSPANKNMTITIRGKTVNWKSLFYRKPKRATVETSQDRNESIYLKVPVKKLYENTRLTDTYTYDLLSLLSFDRRSSVYIYGREPNDKIVLADFLNDLEDEIIGCCVPVMNGKRRVWYALQADERNRDELIMKLNSLLAGKTFKAIGLVLTLSEIKGNFSFVQTVLDNVFRNNPTSIITVLIDCPTRNITVLEKLKNALSITSFTNVFISGRLNFEEVKAERRNTLLGNNEDYANIIYCLENHLSGIDETEFKQIQETLRSLDKIKHHLGNGSRQVSKFSAKGLIADFNKAIESGGDSAEDWQQFYLELLSVFDIHMPELADGIFYCAASSPNDFIRFSTLNYAITGGKLHLVDYWIEGSGCKHEHFENIETIGPYITSVLFYPILRYYNRHKNIKGLAEQVRRLLSDVLKGREYYDYPLAEKILDGHAKTYLAEVLSNYSVSVMKLFEAGVDLFESTDASVWKNESISDEMLDKMLLSAKMSSKKISLICENYQHLIINH